MPGGGAVSSSGSKHQTGIASGEVFKFLRLFTDSGVKVPRTLVVLKAYPSTESRYS